MAVTSARPVTTRLFDGRYSVGIEGGRNSGCSLMDDGSVWCWGENPFGQVGSGQTLEDHLLMVEAFQYDGVAEVGVGGTGFMCGRHGAGNVICAGNNFSGALGNGNNDNSTPVVDVAGIADVERLATGGGFNCVLRSDRTAWCWGDNRSNQLGGASGSSSNVPVQVVGVSTTRALWAGNAHACATTDAGLFCWGENAEGTLGDGTRNLRTSPVAAAPSVPADEIVEMALGANHSCARLRNGSLRCWGLGTSGQLGNGSPTSSLVPVAVVPEP
jgi:alpha-tubulin suppressor-like RCC1 family protein